jgi:uncharacterized SAM-binding protein YcdF (DUF218 family)
MKKPLNALKPRRPWSKVLVTSATLILLAVLVWTFRIPILTGIGNYLVVNDQLQLADIIFVLNGDFNTRPFFASDLYKQGLAPLVGIARAEDLPATKLGLVPNDTDVSIGVIKTLGVPADKIIVLPFPGGVTSTFDEATALHDYIESNNIQRVILVTSAFHTRRARWIFNRELSELPVTLEMAAAPNVGFNSTNWWKNEEGLITLNNEYVKLVYYFLKYR